MTLSIQDLRYLRFGPYSFEVHAGDRLMIAGPSGCGKTRLLRAIALLDCDIAYTDMALDNKSCTSMMPHQWRRMLGLVPSRGLWWHARVCEHFDMNAPELVADAEALHVPMPLFDTECNKLSAGENARLTLLRTLQQAPRALLLDEPTANLDTANTAALEAFILRYQAKKNIPIVWISHSPEQIERMATARLEMKGRAEA